MKQFLIVLKFELNNYFKNKGFLVTTFLLAFVLAAIVIVPTVIPGFLDDEPQEEPKIIEEIVGEPDEEEELERLGIYLDSEAGVEGNLFESIYEADWVTYDSKEKLTQDVESGEIEAGFVVENSMEITYVVQDMSMHDYLASMIQMSLEEIYKQQYLMNKGLTEEEILESESFYVNMEHEILGKDSGENYWYTYVLVFVVYFLIIFYGQMIATSVTTEKSNRAIEILVTSVSSNSLICGKVLAGAIAGVVQAAVILGAGFAAYGATKEAWGGMLDFLFNIPTNVLLVYAVFAVLSYVLYAFIFGMLGALVSKTEDISKSSTPVLMIYIVSFMIAMFGMTSNSNSLLMKVASYIPFTSGNAMFIRVSMGSVEIWEVLISAAILIISCIAAGVLAAKIFRFGTLHYGNPIKLGTAIKKVKVEK